MKRGFTLIEVIVTMAIVSLLAGISAPKIISMSKKSRLEEFTLSFASIISEAYQNSNNEDDYSFWKVEIDNCYSRDNVIVRLKKGDSIIKKIVPENIELELYETNTENFSDGIFEINFDSLGYLHCNSNSESHALDSMDIEVMEKGGYDGMMVHIKSLPPGTVTVETVE